MYKGVFSYNVQKLQQWPNTFFFVSRKLKRDIQFRLRLNPGVCLWTIEIRDWEVTWKANLCPLGILCFSVDGGKLNQTVQTQGRWQDCPILPPPLAWIPACNHSPQYYIGWIYIRSCFSRMAVMTLMGMGLCGVAKDKTPVERSL